MMDRARRVACLHCGGEHVLPFVRGYGSLCERLRHERHMPSYVTFCMRVVAVTVVGLSRGVGTARQPRHSRWLVRAVLAVASIVIHEPLF